jgi:hypothetical protein
VTKNVGDFSLMLGVPAKKKCDIREIESREKKGDKYYPWMYNFDRGMPWSDFGYEEWLKNK